MGAGGETISSERGRQRILLTGDIGKAFLDADDVARAGCAVCPNVLDAIDVAAKGGFTTVGVVMSAVSGRLDAALKALRRSCDARIVLLAQMSEEPKAMRLTEAGRNGAGAADDYVICPVGFSAFVSGLSVTAAAAGVDSRFEKRIRLLERLATEDDLTGLKNKRYIWEFSRQIIERAGREEGRVTLLVFDVDDLKHYNDLYGHLAGDEILKEAAVLIRRCCRAHDVVGRVGGDEFAVVFWDDPRRKRARDERRSAGDHPTEAISIAKRFVSELEHAGSKLLGPRGRGVLTISGGLASFPRDGATIQELFEQADRALLDAKRSGKNRIYLVGRPQSDISDIK